MRYASVLTAVLVLAAAAAAACAPAAGPAPDRPPATGPAIAAQRAWALNQSTNYAYELDVAFYSLHRGRYAVEVRSGTVASVRDAATGAPAEAAREWIVTVAELLLMINEASATGTPVRATYDPRMGYPTEAAIGTAGDEPGVLYRIRNLRAL